MIQINIKLLVEAIREAEVFSLPDMSAGADYIYNNLYKRLTHGEELRLSKIDWSRFELNDIDTMRELYFDTLENNERKADSIASILRGIPPAATVATFV